VQTRINYQIHARQIRVIDADGGQLGVLDTPEALRLAESKDLDLVEIAPTADPPVCRIMDYGKFRYEKKKKSQESKRRFVTTRSEDGIGLTGTTLISRSHIRKFGAGQRVKVSCSSWAEITHPEIGRDKLLGYLKK
jgi:translation initiation factor IF-3